MASLGSHSHGKSSVRVAKVTRGADGVHQFADLSVDVQLEGGTEQSFTHGDNSSVVATDTCKNHVYMMAKEHPVDSPESFALAVAGKFIEEYPFVTRVRVRCTKRPWVRVRLRSEPHKHGFSRGAGDRIATVVMQRNGNAVQLVSEIDGIDILKTTQSGWEKFFQDRFTTLPPTNERLLASTLHLTWTVADTRSTDFNVVADSVLDAALTEFYGPATTGVYSAGVQETIYKMGSRVLAKVPSVEQIKLSLPNLHFLPAHLPVFAKNGVRFEDDVYVPTSEPHGTIECVVARRRARM
eukprot:Plantae.Rhodophyta-Rhodochaete_pulchella.ctg28583.p1 GENE.Plantae.Rhodophyta-Rhodochaete_pulchella.ctg28583~~Plantae.Rhodophyta-Rhodochaete_pulchella.ctg28583.p1  ORF type:complete len:296 (-),score=29.53 Plantae.Rhodophyta-Rhodochaete_pulchella.ctg28583:44-931(-)